MTITAELADGQKLEFPDGTDPAVVQRVVKQQTQERAKVSAAKPPAPASQGGMEKPSGVLSFDEIKSRVADTGKKALNEITAGEQVIGSVASSMIAKPVSNVAGLAATAFEALSPNDDNIGMPADFKKHVEDMLTYTPSSTIAKGVLSVASLPGRAVGAVAGGVGDSLRGGKPGETDASSVRGMAGNAVEEGLKSAAEILTARYAPEIAAAGGKITAPILQKAAQIPGKVGEAARMLSGASADAAKAAAESNVKRQATDAQWKEAAKAEEELVRTRATKQTQAKLQQQLEQGKAQPLDAHAQGKVIEETFTDAIATSTKAAKANAEINYAAADAEAMAKAAKGQAPKVEAAKKPLEDLMQKAAGTPYEAKIASALKMFEESETKPSGEAMLAELDQVKAAQTAKSAQALESRTFGTQAAKGRAIREAAARGADPTKALKPEAKPQGAEPVPQAAAEATGKNFQQLRVVSRILHEMANDPALAGGSKSQLGLAMKEASAALDKSLGEFSPKYKEANSAYKRDMEAVASLNTKYGKAITDTEGGFTGDKSAKVPRQDLAKRVFSTTEGIKLFEEAAAGGPHASAEAKASAHKLTDDLLEQDIREKIRSASTPKAAIAVTEGTGVRAALDSSGHAGVRARANAAAKEAAGKTATVDALDKALADSRARRAEAQGRAQDLEQRVRKADELSKQGNVKDQQAAFREYQSILDGMLKNKQITPEAYAQSQRLFSRANTVAEKTARARSIAKWAAATIGIGVADEAVHKLL